MIEYIARVTCTCGLQIEVPAHVEMESTGSMYQSYDVGKLACDLPNDWLGGYDDDHPPICPECVKKKYA